MHTQFHVLSPADDFLPFWDPHWPLLVKTRSRLHSSGSVHVRREVFLSKFSHIRESQMLGNLVLTLCVPWHLGILCAAVIRLPYLIGTIGWSSRRSSCCATHTVQNVPLFCSSHSRKLATLGKCHIVGMFFVLLVSPEYIWDCFCFFFLYSFCMLKSLCELL